MNNILLKTIYMLSKYFLYGFLMQLLFLNFGLAIHAKGQYKSIEEVTVNISKEQLTLGQFFREVQRQTPFTFSYDSKKIDRHTPLVFEHTEGTVEDFLIRASEQSVLSFRQYNNSIDVLKDERGDRVVVLEEEDPVMITGTVTDTNGDPLPGVTVSIPGTGIGTATDMDGRYSLSVPEGSTLVFSFIGFESQQITVGNQTIIDITLSEDMTSLDEVVVVGYGTVRKSDLTGSIASVGEDDIKATPVVSLDRALQGRAAGVMVTASSGAPGASTMIRIRGTGSVNAGNDPLYVIDGYPTSNLNSINPNDIESIEILKDASATAIYGSRGSNGVVIVTTKRGKEGQSNIDFESYYGIQNIRRKIPLLNAREYAEFFNEARINAENTAYFDGSSPERPLPETLGEGTNWQEEVLRPAPISNYQLTFSGGEERTKYSVSGNYFDQQGIISNSFFKRYSLRANIDRDVKSWLKIGLSMQGAHTRSNSSFTPAQGGLGGGVINAALNFAPVFPIYDEAGKYYRDFSSLNGNLVDNPVGLANERIEQYNTLRLLSNMFAEFYIADGLVFRTSWGADLFSAKSNLYSTRLIELGAGSNGVASVAAGQNLNWLNENTVTYGRTIGDRLSLSALLGYTTQAYYNESVTANAANFNNDFALFHNLGTAAALRAAASGAGEWALISYLSRINLGWDNRYLLTLTARADGSSRFGPNNKYGFFPSGAFAWRIINEKFLSNQQWISDLKLRTSYGITGNQNIGDYQYLSNMATSTAVLGGANPVLQTGATPSGISNLDLSWEKNIQFDAGLDMGLFGDRLQITADYYIRTTSDLLFSVNVPQTTGYSSSLRNIGKVENRGWEFAVKSYNINKGEFQWNTKFNIAFNKNKVLMLDGRSEFLSGSGIGHLQISNTVLLRVDEPLGNFYGRSMDGIFQNQQEIDASAQRNASSGDIRYRDLNGDGIINDEDRTIIGNGYPDFFGGINNTFSFKGFDLNIFLQGSYGNDILNYGRFDILSLNGNGNQSKEVLNRWTETNPSNEIPRANAAGGRILSSFHVEDGSYLRLKNISLSYNFHSSLLNKILVRDIKFYIAAQNHLTFTRYKGYDPEINRFESSSISQGMDFGSYPTAKTLLVGLNFNF